MQKIWSFLCENHEKLGMGNIKFCILIYSIVIINANPSTAITGINLRDFEINHLVSRSVICSLCLGSVQMAFSKSPCLINPFNVLYIYLSEYE